MPHLSKIPDGTQVVPASRVERAKRQRSRRRIGLVVLIGLALTVGVAGKALAWHALVSGAADCEQTTVTVTVPDESWVEDDTVASGTVALDGQSKPWSVNGAGSTTVVFPGVNGGTAVASGTFNTGEPAGGTVQIPSVADCEQEPPVEEEPPAEEPPTEEEPPVKEEPKNEFAGTATDKKRTEPNPDDSIPVAPKQPSETMGALPFTGPREDMQRAMGLGGLVLLLGGTLLVRASRRKEVEQG